MTDIDVVTWGDGERSRVALVHGSLATGPLEWEQQQPLTAEGYQLVAPGAGHEMQLVAEGFNALLLQLWRETDQAAASPA